MSRGFTAAEIAMLTDPSLRREHLVKMVFSTTEYFTTAPMDISYSGDTYVSTGRMMSVSNITENIMPTVGSASITMSGLDADNISIMLTENFIDVPVAIAMILLDDNWATKLVYEIFTGLIKKPTLTEDVDRGTATIVWNLASHWATFEQMRGMYCNINDHQRFYSGDTFFKFADQTQRNIKWGRS